MGRDGSFFFFGPVTCK